jgi:flagellar biosynthesis protein FlhG
MSIEDQASRLRELIKQSRNCRTIAVVSGKGGVGKSNIALNLSILLSAAGNRVTLVDCDLGLANLDVLVDVDLRANLSHVIGGGRRLADVITTLPGGVQFVPGASGLTRIAHLGEFQRAQLLSELSELQSDNDMIVIDCGAGIGSDVLALACSADIVLVVTAPEPTAVTDAYAVVKVLTQRNCQGRLSLLVNFAADRNEARATYQRISGVARQFLGARVLDAGYVLSDPRVGEAVCRRQPLVLSFPRSAASRCIAALATKLCRADVLMEPREGFFRRVANWLS